MTREEAIHKMEYSKRAYQMLIDEKVQEGVLVGQGINCEWSADTPIIDAYKDMLEACDMAIKALEQEPKTGHWIPVSERLPELREDEDDTFISDNVLVWLSHEFDAENPMICYYFKYDEWEGFVPTALCKDWQDINSGLIHPVAWMPLPEPYKAERWDKK